MTCVMDLGSSPMLLSGVGVRYHANLHVLLLVLPWGWTKNSTDASLARAFVLTLRTTPIQEQPEREVQASVSALHVIKPSPSGLESWFDTVLSFNGGS